MMLAALVGAAFLAGVLVSVSRGVNGRLSLSTSPLRASLWNHVVGFAFLAAVAALFVRAWPPDSGWIPEAPPIAWLGGPIGVVFVASGSYLIARIGAALTAMLVIAGQMISGVVLDAAMGRPGNVWLNVAGVGLILSGMWLMQRRRG